MHISRIKIILLHYENAITLDITFFNYLCVHYVKCDGYFRAHIEFMYTNDIPPS